MLIGKVIRGLLSFAGAGASCGAFAYASSFDAFKTQLYTQTSDSAPVTPNTYAFDARIFLSYQADADTGTVTSPSGVNYAMPKVQYTPMIEPNYLFYGDASATSQAQVDATYSTGTYTYTLNGGSNGYDGNQASLTMGPDDFSTTVPFLKGGTYSGLQGMDPTKSVNVQWNDFNDSLSTSYHETFFEVLDLTAGGTIAYSNNGLSAAYKSDTITSGTLVAGHQYQYLLFFSSRFYQSSGIGDALNGFYGSTALASFDFGTSGTFTPAPEPMTVAGLAVGALALLRRRRA